MFCKKCGKEIKDGSKFCPYCGSSLSVEVKQETISQQTGDIASETNQEIKQDVVQEPNSVSQTQASQRVVEQAPKAPRKPMTKKQKITIGAISGVVVVVVVVLCVFVFGPKRINLAENLVLHSKGYDGYGTAWFGSTIDETSVSVLDQLHKQEDSLQDEYENICLLTAAALSKDCVKMAQDDYYLEAALDSVVFDYDFQGKEENRLSNGDKVNLTIKYDEDAFKKAGYTITKNTISAVVEGLEVPQNVDLFTPLEFTWKKGWSGYYLALENEDDLPIDKSYYAVEDVDENGDVVVFVNADDVVEKYGYVTADGIYAKKIHVGSQPREITYIDDSNRAQVEEMAMNLLNTVYIDKCGWNLYNGSDVELITSKEITKVYTTWSGIKAEFDIHTDGNHTFKKTIQFNGYVDSEGNYKVSTDIEKDGLGCTIKNGTWNEY